MTAKPKADGIRAADTSITDTAVRAFLKTAEVNSALACETQTGLHLRKLSKGGSWRYRYNDVTGTRKVKTIGSYPAMKPPEAAWWAREWRHNGVDPIAERKEARAAAITAEEEAARRTIRAYLDGPYTRAQSRKKGGGQSTLDRIRSVFGGWLDRDMMTIAKADIQDWQQQRERKGIAHTTLRRDYGALKTMVRHAFKNEALPHHPLQDVELEAPTHDEKKAAFTVGKTERRMLTDAERIGLLQGLEAFDAKRRAQRRSTREHGKPELASLDDVAFAHWFVPFAHLALHTGLRPGDLHSLTWRELNIQFGRLMKHPEKTLHHLDPIKVDLPLNDEIRAIMSRWWQQCGKPADGLVFASPITKRQLTHKAHLKPWATVKALGRLPADMDFYSLRHNFISTLLHLGVSVFEVARLVGHKGTQMIEQHYGHLCPAAATTAMQALGVALTTKKSEPEESEKLSA